jgi:hypothetical protein
MIDLDIVYEILVSAAKTPDRPFTYSDLSERYQESTGEYHEPYGSWDAPLGDVNRRVANAGLPPLSVIVWLKETYQPGGGFWGASPNAPARPKNERERDALLLRLLNEVWAANWPAALP